MNEWIALRGGSAHVLRYWLGGDSTPANALTDDTGTNVLTDDAGVNDLTPP